MKTFIIVILILLAPMSAYAVETYIELIVPNTFVAGETATAEAVNSNFTALANAINKMQTNTTTSIETTTRHVVSDKNTDRTTTSELLSVSCLSGEILISGGCECYSENYDQVMSNYWASLHTCRPFSNGYSGYCLVGYADWDPDKYGPPITVYAICAKISNNKVNKTQTNEDSTETIERIQKQMDEYESYMIDKLSKQNQD